MWLLGFLTDHLSHDNTKVYCKFIESKQQTLCIWTTACLDSAKPKHFVSLVEILLNFLPTGNLMMTKKEKTCKKLPFCITVFAFNFPNLLKNKSHIFPRVAFLTIFFRDNMTPRECITIVCLAFFLLVFDKDYVYAIPMSYSCISILISTSP